MDHKITRPHVIRPCIHMSHYRLYTFQMLATLFERCMKRRGVKETDPYDWEKLESAGHSSSNNISSQNNMPSNIQSHIQVKTDQIHGGTGVIGITGNATTIGATNASALEYVSIRHVSMQQSPFYQLRLFKNGQNFNVLSRLFGTRFKLIRTAMQQIPPRTIRWVILGSPTSCNQMVCLFNSSHWIKFGLVNLSKWNLLFTLRTIAEDTPSEQKGKQNQQQPATENDIQNIATGMISQSFNASVNHQQSQNNSQQSPAVSIYQQKYQQSTFYFSYEHHIFSTNTIFYCMLSSARIGRFNNR